MDVLYRYWDGPLYVVVSQTLYESTPLLEFGSLPPYYYSAHLVFYPAFIRLFSFVLFPFDAMLLATLFFAVLSVITFYFLVKEFKYTKHPLFLSVIFVFFPVRWLIYHSVGATEAPFIFLVLASFYFFKRNQYWLSAAFGALAATTRVFGVTLFAFYALYFLWKRRVQWRSALPYLLIPLALFLHFLYYHFVYGDFFVYASVNSFVLQWLPFQAVIGYGGAAVGEYWMLLYLLYGAGIARLYQQRRFDLVLFALILYLPALFLSHNDVARYLLPAFPFALLIAFEDIWSNKLVKYPLVPFLFGAYLHVWHVLPLNLMPAEEFARLLSLL